MSEAQFFHIRQHIALFVAVVFAIALKIYVISSYGPIALGDNSGFINAAREILSGSQWLSDAGLDAEVYPPTLWRPIGYSMIVAGSKLLFGEYWSIALCTFQATLSLLTGILLYKLCLAAKINKPTAAVVFLLYQWSTPVSTDALIMEDALTGVLGMTSFLILLFPIVRNEIPRTRIFLLVGVMAAIAYLIRDVYFFVMPVLALISWVVLAYVQGPKRGPMAAGALVLPVAMIATLLMGWNYLRTGSAVTTTAGQSAYLYALVQAAQYDGSIISGDDVFQTTIRKENITFDYIDTGRINVALFENHQMNSIEQAAAAKKLFWNTLLTHPAPMIRSALARLRIVQQGTLFTGPITRLDDLDWWSGGAKAEGFYSTGWRAQAQEFRKTLSLSSLTPEVFFHLGLRLSLRIVGVIALIVFLIGAPWLWLKKRDQLGGIAHAVAIVWGVYLLWVFMYIPVSFEIRYLSPLIGPALMTVAIIFIQLWGQYAQYRESKTGN